MEGQAQAAAIAATATKARARREFEALMRPAVRRIQTNATTSDAQRAALGITIPARTRTGHGLDLASHDEG